VVAVYAMLRALEAGYQAALMAPDRDAREQHAITLGRLLAAEATPFALLTGASAAPVRRRALNQLASGELGLINRDARPDRADRPVPPASASAWSTSSTASGSSSARALDSKGVEGMAPHVLHMTATADPADALADRLRGPRHDRAARASPAGRIPVTTKVVGEGRSRGRPTSSSASGCGRDARRSSSVPWSRSPRTARQAAGEEAERLRRGPLRDFRVGLLHGQMHSNLKAEAMRAFAAGETDVLVATTVIEVGDRRCRTATVMVIEGAERFGVSQLHQLRGRVGRGEHPSQCLLFAAEAGEMARRRLRGGRGHPRRLPARRGRPRTARRRGDPRHPPERPAALRRRLVTGGRPRPGRSPRRGPRPDCASTARSKTRASVPLLEAARRRFGAGAADPIPLVSADAGDRRRVEGAAAVASQGLEGAARPRSRVREAIFSRSPRGSRAPPSSTSTAGTGALGDRGASSRGAARATLVDRDTRPSLGNVQRLGLADRVELIRADAGAWLAARTNATPYDLVFVDAPYKLADLVAEQLDTHLPGVLAADGRAVVESGARRPLAIDSLERLRQRRYGAADVSIYGRAEG